MSSGEGSPAWRHVPQHVAWEIRMLNRSAVILATALLLGVANASFADDAGTSAAQAGHAQKEDAARTLGPILNDRNSTPQRGGMTNRGATDRAQSAQDPNRPDKSSLNADDAAGATRAPSMK
jgi:hypothetical protein